MSDVNKTEALGRSVLGAELDAAETLALAERMGVERVPDGASLVKEGEPRRSLFLLAAGTLEVHRPTAGTDETVYRMHVGECAGTRAFVDAQPRKAELRAVGDSIVLTLEPEDFESLLDTHPRLVLKVMRAIFRMTHTHLMRMNFESTELRNYVSRTHGRY